MAIPQADLLQILDDLGAGLIDIKEAAERAQVLDTEPGKYRCGSCQRFKAGECWNPGKPPRRENAYSVRCGDYIGWTQRDRALPVQPERGTSRMFK